MAAQARVGGRKGVGESAFGGARRNAYAGEISRTRIGAGESRRAAGRRRRAAACADLGDRIDSRVVPAHGDRPIGARVLPGGDRRIDARVLPVGDRPIGDRTFAGVRVPAERLRRARKA